MGFLHVLFAVTLTLAFVRARLIFALEQFHFSKVLVVHMAVTLLLSRPSIFVIFAIDFGALLGPAMSLLVSPVMI